MLPVVSVYRQAAAVPVDTWTCPHCGRDLSAERPFVCMRGLLCNADGEDHAHLYCQDCQRDVITLSPPEADDRWRELG